MRTHSLAFLLVAAVAGCKGHQELISKLEHDDPATATDGSGSAEDIGPTTAEEAAQRVAAVFPNGPATDKFEVKAAITPIATTVVDPTSAWVIEIPFRTPLTSEAILDALGDSPTTNTSISFAGRRGAQPWVNIDDVEDEATFDRIAVSVALVDVDLVLGADDVTAVRSWLDGAVTKLHASAPNYGKPQAAVARAATVATVMREFDDQGTITVTIQREGEAPIPQKLAWDALYSAGFSMREYGMMDWLPTDGIWGVGAFNESLDGIWHPEEAIKPGATFEDIELHVDLLRAPQPDRMVEAMLQEAHYIAKRVGGHVIDDETHAALDEAALRKRVAGRLKLLTANGIVPGSDLATAM
ncbi:MAG TPA: hypothetical protein VGM39_22590 [Kofleriaceae bacterium]|jgi:hypothetical protein